MPGSPWLRAILPLPGSVSSSNPIRRGADEISVAPELLYPEVVSVLRQLEIKPARTERVELTPDEEDLYGEWRRLALADAHADFNTPETTMSGWLGGMPVSMDPPVCDSSSSGCPREST